MNEVRITARGGFSLVELLAVLAIIGLLVSIVVPVVGGIQNSARESKTRAQLGQYALAYQAFHGDRGFYPRMGESGAEFNVADDNATFIAALSGYLLNGERPPAESEAAILNPRGTAYYRFQAAEFASDDHPATAGLLVDAFGNPNIVVVVDHDRNHVIRAADFSLLDAVERPVSLSGGVALYVFAPPENTEGWRTILGWR